MQKFLLNFYMHFSQYFLCILLWQQEISFFLSPCLITINFSGFYFSPEIHFVQVHTHNSRLHQQSDFTVQTCKLVPLRLAIHRDVEDAKLQVQFFRNFIGISYIPLPALAISRLILLEQSTLSFSAMASSSCEKGAGLLKASCQCRQYINIKFHIYSSRNSLSTFTVYYYCYKQKIYIKLIFYFSEKLTTVLVAARKKK